jgi:hypothetical protein
VEQIVAKGKCGYSGGNPLAVNFLNRRIVGLERRLNRFKMK